MQATSFLAICRHLWKNKTNSFLNISGLAVGIACAGLIFLWVENEMRFDQFNVKKDRLYVARVNAVMDAGVFTHWSTPGIMAPAMQSEIPGITNTCRVTEDETRLLFTIGENSVYAGGKYAEPSIFNMFTLPFTEGDSKQAFAQLHSLVITQKTARRFFGTDHQLLGKTIRVDNRQDYVITGILKDLPEYSTLQFEWLAPFQIWYQQSPWAYEWANNCLTTYVELSPAASIDKVNKQVYNFVQKRAPTSTGHVLLHGMNDWRLHDRFENGKPTGGGRIEYVKLFSVIAWIILAIACINFMNLSTARSEKRAREVGVRKVLGAARNSLVLQFIGEALLMSGIATIIAVLIIAIALPGFNTLVNKNMPLELNSPIHIAGLVSVAVLCGLIAGSYPSFFLSSFKPTAVLKGMQSKSGSAVFIRKGLVVFQFAISVILIIGTMVIYKQLEHVKERNLGFSKDNLLEIPMQGDMAKNYTAIKQDMLATGFVDNVALADHTIIEGGNNTDGLSWEGKPAGARILISSRYVSNEYLSATGLKLLEGRDFQITDTTQGKHFNVIITQSLARLMGSGSAIGKMLYFEGDTSNTRAIVVGVIKDYVYGNMYGKPDPVIFVCTQPKNTILLYARTKPGLPVNNALAAISAVMKKNNPGYPFEYHFVDAQFNQMFNNELLIGKLSRIFASLAIIISCLGLFGLAAYTAERRIKEIGVRKVLGASVTGIAALLSKDFLKLVFIACLLAFPVSWWSMSKWLENYQYRINIHWQIFALAAIIAIFIAVFTVSFQAIKAAMANPVISLRSE